MNSIVKNSKYSYKHANYFRLSPDINKENCKFAFHFNKTDITPTVLDGGNGIILVNWPNDKHIICNVNNDIPVKIPSHPYVLINRKLLCSCGIEAENNFLLESLAACHDANSKLVMYFTVNTAFGNSLDSLNNLIDSLTFPLLMNRTTFEQTLPIFTFDYKLLMAPKTLKDLFTNIIIHRKFFICRKGLPIQTYNCLTKNVFNNYTIDIFLFVTVMISLLVTTIVMYTLHKHMKLKTLVTSLALQIKEVSAVTRQDDIMSNIECTCKIQWYTNLVLSVSIWGSVLFVILKKEI